MPRHELFFKSFSAPEEVIRAIKIYQNEIDNQQERKKQLEELLKKNISSFCRKRAYNKVRYLKEEINHHQNELAKIIKWKAK